jgi:YegS/Rv2252/BmrU family lipid kinase
MSGGEVVFVVNPISGWGARDGLIEQAAERLREFGYGASVRKTAAAGDGAIIAREAPEEAVALVAVGGDGTVREVVAGAADRGTPVLPVPAGTENLIAKYFGVMLSVDCIVDTIVGGRVRACDVGLLNGRRFLIVAGIGFDADVVDRLSQRRRGHITIASYFQPMWQSFWRYDFPSMEIELDGEVVFEGRGMAFVGLLPCYARGMDVLSRAVPDDGLMDLCVLPCDGRGQLVGRAWQIARGVHAEAGGVIYMHGKHLRAMSGSAVPVQCDGDPVGDLPIEITLDPKPARFLVPPK